jgi:hypothetical protein
MLLDIFSPETLSEPYLVDFGFGLMPIQRCDVFVRPPRGHHRALIDNTLPFNTLECCTRILFEQPEEDYYSSEYPRRVVGPHQLLTNVNEKAQDAFQPK